MTLTARRIQEDDGALLGAMRLRALADSPSAFGSTYEAEALRTAEDWTARAAHGAVAADRVTFFAFLDTRPVGLAGGYWSEPDIGRVDLVSMWVSPSARRRGVARSLIRSVLDWAVDVCATSVGLWVTAGNTPAVKLYSGFGFAATGERQPLPSDTGKEELRMILDPLSADLGPSAIRDHNEHEEATGASG